MEIQDIYNQQKDNLLFSDSEIFNSYRNELINSFNIKSKEIKNNESLKYFDRSIIDNFKYKYSDLSSKHIFQKNSKINKKQINILNGKLNIVENFNDETLKIKIINNKNLFFENQIEKNNNFFKEDYIVKLNSIMMNAGYELNIKNNKNEKIYITNTVNLDGITVFQKNFLTIGKNSRLVIIETYLNDIPSNINAINFFDIQDNAEVTHLIFQKNKLAANLQLTSHASCGVNSKYKQVTFNLSDGSSRNHHYVNLNGKKSSADLLGVFFGSKKQIIDNKTQVNHNQTDSNSNQKYKGILTDQSRASYLSKTFVDKIAQKTEAYQLSKGIILSDNSYFHSKPELKIYADDVKCSHGSTIGPLDSDLLFYLRTRGLSKKKAVSLLIQSFFHDITSLIQEKDFLSLVNKHSNEWLKENDI